ncbi:hypothetical protein DFH07DRAFT_793208 [Mycena maculata]|uniref:F-box domain-containing protein n=1 Tax=Mycena maculata TaxID=230809 RepID=A0AAD7KAU3_9AGAR|nr:hypothetical protein DFH07DRAFT_793208 [Mycena maculata]
MAPRSSFTGAHLVRCRLRATRRTPFIAGPTAALPYLKTLILAADFDYVQFMKCLVLPHLRYLRVGDIDINLTAVESSIAELTLQTHSLLPDDILGLLKVLPRTSRLRVNNYDYWLMDDAFLSGLDPALLKFIKARMRPLSRIEANFRRAMDVDILQELQPWDTAGLQMNLGYWPNSSEREFTAGRSRFPLFSKDAE